VPTTQKVRFRDLTPEHVLVLADKVKEEQGLGLTGLDPAGPTQLAYLCFVPPQLEAAFTQVFPHLPARVRAFNNYGGRDTYLFEEKALLAVLRAFGLAPCQLERHVHAWYRNTYVRVRRPRRRHAPSRAMERRSEVGILPRGDNDLCIQ
jgi:hypothetical protein